MALSAVAKRQLRAWFDPTGDPDPPDLVEAASREDLAATLQGIADAETVEAPRPSPHHRREHPAHALRAAPAGAAARDRSR
jgi:hypothetical protein